MTPNLRTLALWVVVVFCLAGGSLTWSQDVLDRYVTSADLPVRKLDATESFGALSDQEKNYAHWMSLASWLGAEIGFYQASSESPDILQMLLRLYSVNRVSLRREAHRLGVTDEELRWLRQYAAQFLSNTGNYLSFGDTKFVPRISPQKMESVLSAASIVDPGLKKMLSELWGRTRQAVYSLAPDVRSLGLDDKGTSSYYSENITREEIALVNGYMVARGISPYNTRVFKDGETGTLELKTASANKKLTHGVQHEGRDIVMTYGDHGRILRSVVECLEKALLYVANENQRNMVLRYIAHFNGGDIDDHKDAMRYWVKDVGPVVETNIGFIESYRDPMGSRGEWEGFVSIVNKEQTRKFSRLVGGAPAFVARLPWGAAFEKDKYHRPDFTSLDVIAFASSGIPAGINIPNYDEIRQNEGFKNVSLGNVLSSSSPSKNRITLLAEGDQDVYRRLRNESFEVQVGLHELLGHGTGKLFYENEDGTFNFDRKKTINPLTGQPVTSWYKPGQTWNSQFSRIASTYEECRAEAVGIYLSIDEEILKIFGHEGQDASDITYVNWLSMARAGVSALTFYDPDNDKWGQAHMQGRFALLQVMLEAGDGLLEVTEKDGEWTIHLDREKIATVGRKAVGDFLTRLMVYKSTSDVEGGTAFYRRYTSVEPSLLKIRNYVFKSRRPRHVWVQPVTDVDRQGRVFLREYPANYRGVIDSFLDRYSYMTKE